MSDDVSVRFGAQTQGVDAGVADVKKQLASLDATLAALRAAFNGVASGSAAAFAAIKEGAAETRTAIMETAEVMRGIRGGAAGLGEAFMAAFAVHEITEFARKMGEAGEKVEHLHQRLGISIADVQLLGAAATMSGLDIDIVAGAVGRLDRSFAAARQGAKIQIEGFHELGVSTKENYTQIQLLEAVMEGFKSMPDGPQKTAVAMEVLGKAGAALIPFLNLGKEGFQELTAAMERYGIQDAEAVEKGAALGRSFNENKVAMQGLGNVMADAFAPEIKGIVDGLNDMIAAFIKSYKDGGLVKTICEWLVIAVQATIIVFMMLAEVMVQAWVIIKGTWDSMKADWILVQDIIATGIDAIKASVRSMAMAIGYAIAGQWPQAAAAAVEGMKAAASAGMAHSAKIQADLRHISAVDKQVTDEMSAHWQSFGNNAMKLLQGGSGKGLRTSGGGGEGDTSNLGTRGPKAPKGPSIVDEWRTQLADALNEEKNWGADEAAYSLQFWQAKLALVKAGSKEELEIRREIARAKKTLGQEELREDIARIKELSAEHMSAAKADLEVQKQASIQKIADVDEREKMGIISARKAAQERALINAELRALEAAEADAEYRIHVQELQDELRLERLKPAERAAINLQIEQLEKEHNDRMRALAAQQATAAKADVAAVTQTVFQKWNSTFQQIGQSMASVTQGLLTRTITWASAFQQVGAQMLSMFLGWVFRMGAQWLAMEVTKTAATAAGTGARTGLEVASAAAGIAAHAAAAIAHIAMDAARAAAGAWAAVAGIPYIGPFLAPAMAAAALAGVLALGKSIFSAEGGWGQVPYDGAMTRLHKNEMVLPASIASPLRSALSGGDQGGGLLGGGSGGDVHNHLWNVQALDAKSFGRFLQGPAGQKVVDEMFYRVRMGATAGKRG